MLMDIAILTGGEVISADIGYELKEATLSQCGQAKNAIITKDDTFIINGNGDQARIKERISQLKDLIPATLSDYDKEKLQERLTDLFGVSDLEVQE